MDVHTDNTKLQQPLFLSLAVLGALYLGVLTLRLLTYLGLPNLLRRPTDLRRRYGAWAVVTGPTSGIGRSMALELARRGINILLVGRDRDKLREISDTIAVAFDLSLVATAQGDEAMRRLRQAVEGLDVGLLVNNAGVAKPYAVYLHEFDVEAWVRMIRVNLWALTEVAAAVLPGMLARGRGAIVNMGSGSTEAIPSFPLYTVYASTKRYVAVFSKSLYVAYRSKGIDVQCQADLLCHEDVSDLLEQHKAELDLGRRRSSRLKDKEEGDHVTQADRAVRIKKRKLGSKTPPKAPGRLRAAAAKRKPRSGTSLGSVSTSSALSSASASSTSTADVADSATTAPTWTIQDLKLLASCCGVPDHALPAMDEAPADPPAPVIAPLD